MRKTRAVVVWFGRVGDMIMLTALLHALHRRWGEPCDVLGAGDFVTGIYAGHPDVRRAVGLHRYTPFALDVRWWQALALLRRESGPIYVCETDARKLARIRRLLRWSGVDPGRCVFLVDEPDCRARTHWIDKVMSLGERVPRAWADRAPPWPEPPPDGTPSLCVQPAADRVLAEWLRRHQVGERPLVLLQPGNRRTMRGRALRVRASDDRFWPIERWAELMRRLHAALPEALLVLCGAPREHLLLDWVEEAADLPGRVLRAPPYPGLFALCRRAHSMISIDTGNAHAAAALNLPLLVLFGGTPPAQVWPRSAGGATPVLGIGGAPRATRVDALSVEEVFAKWRALCLAAVRPGARASPP